ncbi:hypothetical protein PTTG_06045 [Puccinia triticina 1-1 BBBD Race 1]|uniref:Ubiquitin-like-conjugating enzyme ATG10 n=1 Tax=Puccinia triticina (isolate 1-1 / race 1 (BBBD)) TaxID=630390 RepID=A0A0C4EYZ0_PUCT1|nr:hypothetical protein PTTG_06045 [Puccinia triticina 1-1 BBBD Race 1]
MLTRDEFNEGCQEFISHAGRHARGWKWETHRPTAIVVNQDLGCLHNEPIDRTLFFDQAPDGRLRAGSDVNGGTVDEHEDEAGLPPVAAPDHADHGPHERIKYQASVVYSDTYGVPQLLFQAYKPDGTHLDLQELVATDIFYRLDAPAVYPRILIGQPAERPAHQQPDQHEPAVRLPILTRTIHPLDNLPYWGLHPCNTQAALKDILDNNHPRPAQHHHPRLVIECFFALVSSLIRV